MLKKTLTALTLTCACTAATAELRPYANGDFGYSDADSQTSVTYTLGAGLQANDHVEFEVAYNDFGDTGVVDYISYSVGMNLGVPLTDDTRLYAILGAEYLDREGSISFDSPAFGSYTRNLDDSSFEAIYGVGAAYSTQDDVEFRVRAVRHGSGELLTVTLGLAYFF